MNSDLLFEGVFMSFDQFLFGLTLKDFMYCKQVLWNNFSRQVASNYF